MPDVVVIPCFNEAARLDEAAFDALARATQATLLFVDDGSTDATAARLEAIVARDPARRALLRMPVNGGKGEAVRAGLTHALRDGATLVGFTDADLATPPAEFARLLEAARTRPLDVVMGSRVARAGARIERSPVRHYLGRAFATYADLLLRAGIYDTQCGAKVFRGGARLERALATPFVSRWVFDVELLARLLHDPLDPLPPSKLLEIPLDAWVDVRGSHIGLRAVPRIALDMARAARSVRAGRARSTR